ncbi:MAG TPA: serine hydrolase [Desulfatiglandales bacterium]|nr:serine hydrolase [Desulfatiglandales bacterium]
MKTRSCLLFLVLTVCFATAFNGQNSAPVISSDGKYLFYNKAIPQNEILKELVEKVENGKYDKVNSILIQIDGELVFERYFHGFDRNKLHFIASAHKTMISASIGIAIDQGKIKSVDEKVLDFFPEYKDIKNLDDRKRNITLKDLLTMSSGLSWEGDNIDMPKIIESDDWIKYMLDLPLSHDPGTFFKYTTGNRILLDGILQNTTGLSAKEFTIKYILTPLGITNYYWKTNKQNIAFHGGDIQFRPIDLIKFGQLYLNEGIWNDKRIISQEWIKLSTSPHIKVNDLHNYGFQWWLLHKNNPFCTTIKENDVFIAIGAGGQIIWIVPHLKLVTVLTAEGNTQQESRAIMWDYIVKFAQNVKNH